MVRRKLAGAGAVRPGFPAETQSLERAARRDGSSGPTASPQLIVPWPPSTTTHPGFRRRSRPRCRIERSAFGQGASPERPRRRCRRRRAPGRPRHPRRRPVAAAESVLPPASASALLETTLRVAVSGAGCRRKPRPVELVAADASRRIGVPRPPGRRSGTANATHHAERFLRATSRSLPRGRPAVKRRAAEGILPRSFPAVVFRTRRGFTRTPHPGPT